MKIIIPMAGQGQRFLDAGYDKPKPLIAIDDKTMIEHVVDMFAKSDEFVFIVDERHVDQHRINKVVKNIKPGAQIYKIKYKKLGPAWGIVDAFKSGLNISSNEEVLVSYCDYKLGWDYKHFAKTLKASGCDGCVVSYIGFHPHLVNNSNRYAGMRVGKNGWVREIREKFSFSENLMDSHQSAGLYYFRKGKSLVKYVNRLVLSGEKVNGEFYVSQVYEHMLKDKLKILAYPVKHFLQWGTPESLSEYLYWSKLFSSIYGK